MTRYTGITPDGEMYHFTFRSCPSCDGTRLEWPVDTSIVLLPFEIVSFVQGKGYSRALSQIEIDAYNEAVDAFIAAAGEPAGEDQGPGAIPAGIEGESAPEGGALPEGEASENEPPVATEGQEAGSDGETPATLPGDQAPASTSKAKKG